MAHYAFLDETGLVTEVIVGKDENEDDIDWEQRYSEIRNQVCKRTSYNTYGGKHLTGGTPFRKNFAGIGFTYDESADAFLPPKPYPSWQLNTESYLWEAPIAYPPSPNPLIWDEAKQNWVSSSDA